MSELEWIWAVPSRALSTVSSSSSEAENTTGYDLSYLQGPSNDNSREEGNKFGKLLHSRYWVRVQPLERQSTDASLIKMFYAHGADEAFTLWENRVLTGYVGFNMEAMAQLAVEKMNGFTPARQTPALTVTLVSLDDALTAHGRATAHPPKPFTSLLYSECPPSVAAMAIEQYPDPVVSAGDVAEEIKLASRTILARLTAVLKELSVRWASRKAFVEELLKLLLLGLLQEEGRNAAHVTNCGVAMGSLFAHKVFFGDPFQLAIRVLERGVHTVEQVDGLCLMAHLCGELQFPVTKASFWALVGHTAATTTNEQLRNALLWQLRQLKVTPPSVTRPAGGSLLPPLPVPLPPAPAPAPAPPAAAAAAASSTKAAADLVRNTLPLFRGRLRTIYVSHLSPTLPQNVLRQLLEAAGSITKVRVCQATGYATLFAFVEMGTEEAASAAIKLTGTPLHCHTVRIECARTPIQDEMSEDAIIDEHGAVLRPCGFGRTSSPLAAAVTVWLTGEGRQVRRPLESH